MLLIAALVVAVVAAVVAVAAVVVGLTEMMVVAVGVAVVAVAAMAAVVYQPMYLLRLPDVSCALVAYWGFLLGFTKRPISKLFQDSFLFHHALNLLSLFLLFTQPSFRSV